MCVCVCVSECVCIKRGEGSREIETCNLLLVLKTSVKVSSCIASFSALEEGGFSSSSSSLLMISSVSRLGQPACKPACTAGSGRWLE